MTELEPILTRLGLAQYVESFIQEGFETWETVLDITESDLDALNVKLGHRRRLQREIFNARGQQSDHLVRQNLRATLGEEKRPFDADEYQDVRKSEEERLVANHGKRKYRRHPKSDENAPVRPPSAYVIFSNKIREDLKPQSLSFTEIAKRVGESWQLLLPEEKERFESQASIDKERYNTEMAKYKKTSKHQEYAAYLADFKLNNADGKRARLESESEGSITVNTDLHASTGSWSSLNQHAASPSRSEPKLPPMTTSFPTTKADSSSPSSHSSTPTLHHNTVGVNQGTERTARKYSPVQKNLYRGKDMTQSPPLPRIQVAEGKEQSTIKGSLPPLSIDPLVQPNLRRSHTVPASFIHHDRSRSSVSSKSSNFSSNSTSSSALYTPNTPLEDVRLHRALPLPSPMLSNSGRALQHGDQCHTMLHPSKVTLPIQGLISKALPQADHISLSSADIPQKRQSLMKLSISPITNPSRRDLRSHSREQTETWLTAEADSQPLQHRTPPFPQCSQYQAAPVSNKREGPIVAQEEKSTGQLFQGLQDPLSVLAYAGRLVDRDSKNL